MADRSSLVAQCKPGGPIKLAEATLQPFDSGKPPLRLPLGTAALKGMADKNLFVESETERWRSLAALHRLVFFCEVPGCWEPFPDT